MKRKSLLYVLPLAALILSGCDFDVKSIINKFTKKDDEKQEQNPDPTPEIKITISESEVSVGVGLTTQLSATLTGAEGTLTWAVTDGAEYASVDQTGKVTGIAEGTALVTVSYGTASAYCMVTVLPESQVVHATDMSIDGTLYPKIEVGETHQISVTFEPEDVTDKSCTFESDALEVATVSSTGLVTALSEGTANITVTSNDNSELSKTVVLTVNPKSATMPASTGADYTIFKSSDELKNGEYVNFAGVIGTQYYGMGLTGGNVINATALTVSDDKLQMDAATYDYQVVKNSDNSYSFVDKNGKYLTAVSGSNYLTGATEIGDLSKFSVSFEDGRLLVRASDSTLDGKARNLALNPNNGNPRFSLYKDTSISGMNAVTMYHNGIELSGNVSVTGVSFGSSSYSVEVGKTVKVSASVSPALATDKEITYSLSDVSPAGCVTIDGDVLTGVAEGTAKVVAKSHDGGFTATADVTVVGSVNYGTAESPLTVSEAMAILTSQCAEAGAYTSEEIYCEGTVSVKGTESTYGFKNTKVSDGTTEALIYSLNLTSEQKADYDVGSVVKFHGYGVNYSGTLEFSNKGSSYVTAISVSAPQVAVTGVSLDVTEATLTVGASKSLIATVAPENATNKDVSWESSAPEVASVSDGLVTAIAVGTTTITVTTADGSFTATCDVTVSAGSVAVTGVSLDKESASILHIPGEPGSLTLTPTLSPESPTNSNVSWSSDNTAVATVENGVVTTVGAGSANIKVTTEDGNFTATCVVTVVSTVHAGTEVDPFDSADACTVANSLPNSGVTTNSYFIKDEVTSKTGSFSPSFGNFTFNMGDFVCYRLKKENNVSFEAESDIEVGDTVLVYSTIQNYYKNGTNTPETKTGYVVSVTKPTATNVSSVSLDKTEVKIGIDGTATLVATVLPSSAVDKSVSWSSDNTNVATVDGGVVTGVAKGTATITVTTTDGGFKATCSVTVVSETYTKVTEAPTSWEGSYVVVAEGIGSGEDAKNYVWTGVDVANGCAEVAIDNNKISKTQSAKLVLEAATGGYYAKIDGGDNNGKYVTFTANSNGFSVGAKDSAAVLTVTISDGSAIITNANGAVLRFNSASNQMRFRFYKTSSYTGQQPIQLFALDAE